MHFLFWRKRDDDLSAELRSHFQMAVQDRVDRGQTKAEAEAAVRREFGNELMVREATRNQWSWTWLEHFVQDLGYGSRLLARTPVFTAVVILTLALGIGANSAMFSIVYGILLRPLPYPDADRIAMVFLHFSPQNAEYGTMSLADYFDWRARNQSFEDPSIFTFGRFNLAGSPNPEQVSGASVSSGFFSTLKLTPLGGRFFVAGEDSPSSARLAVLSEQLWRRRFGARLDVIGSLININGEPTTIIGIAPARMRFPRAETEIWTNLQMVPPTRRGPFFFRGLARLKPGVTFSQARVETDAIAHQIEKANLNTYSQLSIPVVPLREAIVGRVQRALLVVFGAVLFVLLIGLVNIASLLLGRATGRQREMAMRVSLGATRWRLWRQLLTESLMLGLCGGAVGIAVAWAGVQLFRIWNPGGLPRLEAVHLDLPVVVFTLIVSVVSAVLFGMVPAAQSSR
ncbi:MAG TPA: ABC transporter permease, partial [Terriglobales bacterium]|nr:ABC transporter permease [Terriglobales bacterium]